MEAIKEGLKRILTDNMQTYEDKVNEILALIKQAGYVRLSPDQSLPESPYSQPLDATQEIWDEIVIASRQDMLKKGWRKVEL